MHLAKNDGWNVFGSELNPDLAKIGIINYGLEIQCAAFEESTFTDGYFDVITLWNVLDELLDTAGSILKNKKILKPAVFFIQENLMQFFIYVPTEFSRC